MTDQTAGPQRIQMIPLHVSWLDRVAGFIGAWAVRRLFDHECEEYVEGCCACEAKRIIAAMEDIAHGR